MKRQTSVIFSPNDFAGLANSPSAQRDSFVLDDVTNDYDVLNF